jgi:hypothetical protein
MVGNQRKNQAKKKQATPTECINKHPPPSSLSLLFVSASADVFVWKEKAGCRWTSSLTCAHSHTLTKGERKAIRRPSCAATR